MELIGCGAKRVYSTMGEILFLKYYNGKRKDLHNAKSVIFQVFGGLRGKLSSAFLASCLILGIVLEYLRKKKVILGFHALLSDPILEVQFCLCALYPL